jgi:hypothetical protein
MKIFDLTDGAGELIAFEVPSGLLGRAGACAVARAIPGVTMIREGTSELFAREDDFCAFEVEGVRFIISEPFGDNSRFWVGPWPVRPVTQLPIVRAAFERSTWLGRLLRRAG